MCKIDLDSSVFDLYQVEICDEANGVPLTLYERKFPTFESAKNAIRYFVGKRLSIDSLKFWITIYTYDIETFNCLDFHGVSMTYFANYIFKKGGIKK